MDVYKLINSKAIADHCKKIKHEFNTEEIAILIFRNRKINIEEKKKLYNELIEKYPDMEVKERINCRHYDSVKTMIKNEIDRLSNLYEDLIAEEENTIYTYTEYNKSTCKYEYRGNLENARSTFKEIYKSVTDYINEYDDTYYFTITKKELVENGKEIIAEYNVKNKKPILINIYEANSGWLDIDSIFLYLPTPFKRGDILVSLSDTPFMENCLLSRQTIFVLDWMITWRENFNKYETGDSSDMCGEGYFMRDDDTVNFILDHQHCYDMWEYYQGELKGRNRILKAISSLLKNEINLELFIYAYEQIKIENHANDFMNWFTDEGLELAGFSKEDIKQIKGKKE